MPAPTPPEERRIAAWLAWARRLLGLAALAFFVTAAVRPAVSGACARLRAARVHRGETAVEARRRCFGPAFVDGVDRLRATLGPDEPYYLVEGGDPNAGGALWVRYELAPHRAIFLGRFSRLAASGRLRRQVATNIHRVAVALGPGRSPIDWQRFELLAALAKREAAQGGVPP